MSEQDHSHPNYIKIYYTLLGLLVLSIVGPMLEIPWVVLVTAFGIALVKALMVAAYFMHLNIEKRYIWHLLLVCAVFLMILFTFVAPDVLKHSGANWTRIHGATVIQTQAPEVEAVAADHGAASASEGAFE